MTEDNRFESLAAELAKLSGKSAEPSSSMEGEVVGRLRKSGLIESRRRMAGWKFALAACAAVVLFVAGLAVGKLTATSKAPEFTYVLLLEEGNEYQVPAEGAEMDQRVNEYRNWAIGLRKEGVQVSGMKLKDDAVVLGEASGKGDQEMLAGMFSIKTESEEQARRIAESCPHLKHGGKIVIRPIEKT
jgi:hypothetical protein